MGAGGRRAEEPFNPFETKRQRQKITDFSPYYLLLGYHAAPGSDGSLHYFINLVTVVREVNISPPNQAVTNAAMVSFRRQIFNLRTQRG